MSFMGHCLLTAGMINALGNILTKKSLVKYHGRKFLVDCCPETLVDGQLCTDWQIGLELPNCQY